MLVPYGGSAERRSRRPRRGLFNVRSIAPCEHPAHFAKIWMRTRGNGNVAEIISAGWGSGMFSIARLYASSVLPEEQGLHVLGPLACCGGHSEPFVASRGMERYA